ncbi:MAG: hypothetical protein KBS66_07390 [Eubacterium sp.]|nr:hypothetical protein [Candidatus Colimonas fimequi]
MNTVDLLLGLDNNALDFDNTKTLEITRLSKLSGAPFLVKVQGMSANRYTRMMSDAAVKNAKLDKVYDANINVCVTGIVEPSMKDKNLMEKFSCSTPAELLEKLFRPSEINHIAEVIGELSGFGSEDLITEVKN